MNMKSRGVRSSIVAVLAACGAATALLMPAGAALAGHHSRPVCRPAPSHHSSYSYRGHSSPRVGFSVQIGTGGYSKYRSSYSYGYSSGCAPTYYGYSYARPSYSYCPPTYRYECYDTPRVNTYYNNYSYNTYTATPAGATTYRVWQQDLETPAAQPAAPAYPSYNPGPAQPSPAPVAQLERGATQWATVDLQQQQISSGVTKPERSRASMFDDAASARAGATPDQAWEAMRDGDYTSARSAFASLTQTMPDSSDMKLGFGLANALDGRDSAAAWSIRRALASGVKFEIVREEFGGMEKTLDSLASRLADRAEETGGGDGWLVLSVVQSIRGESDAAGFAALQAIEAGDRSEAMNRLAGELGIEVPAKE